MAYRIIKFGKIVSYFWTNQALASRESILSLVHTKVLRLASNSSAISGFSDDFRDDDNDDGLITTGEGAGKEAREYGSISTNVYYQYFKAGGLGMLALFAVLSVGMQSVKVYMDYMLKDWIVQDASQSSLLAYFMTYVVLSCVVTVLTYCYNIIGQWIGANARKQLHDMMVDNIFQYPVDLFEAYPIGRLLNRLSCDMFVIDQKLPSCLQRLVMVSLICLSSLVVNFIQSPFLIPCAIPMIGTYWWVQVNVPNSKKK